MKLLILLFLSFPQPKDTIKADIIYTIQGTDSVKTIAGYVCKQEPKLFLDEHKQPLGPGCSIWEWYER